MIDDARIQDVLKAGDQSGAQIPKLENGALERAWDLGDQPSSRPGAASSPR